MRSRDHQRGRNALALEATHWIDADFPASECDGVIADKAFGTNGLRTNRRYGRRSGNSLQAIPEVPIPHDETAYRKRNRIERCINKMKHFRRVATRYDRRAIHFLAFAVLACFMIWIR